MISVLSFPSFHPIDVACCLFIACRYPYPTRSMPVEPATVLLPTVTVYRSHRMDRRYPHVQHRCRVLKVERPRHRQLDLFVFVLILPRTSPSHRMGIAAIFVVALWHVASCLAGAPLPVPSVVTAQLRSRLAVSRAIF